MPNAVSNTTPLIYLTKVNKLTVLKQVYDGVYVCSPVLEDIANLGKKGILTRQEMRRISYAQSHQWLLKRDSSMKASLDLIETFLDLALGHGEATSLALARELVVFLANDRSAIQVAKRYGIATRWYTEILQDALKAGYLNGHQEYTSLLDMSIEAGLYLSKTQRDKGIGRASYILKMKKT